MSKDAILNKVLENYKKFRAKIEGRVKFSDADAFGVVHNVQYFYWLEFARTEYIRTLGVEMTPTTFVKDYPFMVVRAEMDYFDAARFGDEYEVLSRIAEVKNSSLRFENLIKFKDGDLIAFASAALVYLDYKEKTPKRIPDDLRDKIREFEGDNVIFKESNK